MNALQSSKPPVRPTELGLTVGALDEAVVAGLLVRRAALDAGVLPRIAGELGLVASELATNMVKYAGGGELLLSVGLDQAELTALDRGPGPPSEAELFADGFSRGVQRLPDHGISGGRGTGGGALRRLCDEIELEPREGGGTVIRCRKRLV